jgi:hypothetical protein
MHAALLVMQGVQYLDVLWPGQSQTSGSYLDASVHSNKCMDEEEDDLVMTWHMVQQRCVSLSSSYCVSL